MLHKQGAGLFISFVLTTCAVAAEGPPAIGEVDQLETIVVTAQKRSEDIRNVPISITVVSGQQLAEGRISDFTDLAQSVPGLSFSSQAGPGLSTLELRGISSAAGSATIGIYLDEVPVTIRNLLTLGNTEPQFLDIDRVEVLRGPQGTLYGSSSEGGTIRFISNLPDSTNFSASVRTVLSGTDHAGLNYLASGVLNIPVIENGLAIRIGAQTSLDSGYINQVSPATGNLVARGINTDRNDVLRLTVLAKPSDGLTITPAFFYQRTETDDIDAYYLPDPTYVTSKLVREPGEDTLSVPSVTIAQLWDGAALTSVTSYFYRHFVRTQDGTVGNSSYIGSVLEGEGHDAAATAVSNLPGYIYLNNTNKATTQEVRLASNQSSAPSTFTWLTGVYYSDAKTEVLDVEPIPGLTDTIEHLTGKPPSDPSVLGFSFPNDTTYYSDRDYDERQYAAFGDIGYNITSTLKVSAGVRYQISREALDREGNYYFNGGYALFGEVSDSHALTPKFAATYDLDKDTTLYANISKGYRLGGPNRPIPVTVCAGDLAGLDLKAAPQNYDADALWNYEIGTKSRFLDNRIALNVSAYLIRWNKIQQDVFLEVCGYDFFQNVGSADSYGSEFELDALLAPGLNLSVNGAYDHATFTESLPSLGVHSGDPIEGAPVWNGSINLRYTEPVSPDTRMFTLASFQGTGNSHGALSSRNPDYFRPSYHSTNASFGVDYKRVEVSLFGTNIFDEHKAIQRPNIQGVVEGITLRPRTVGISVSANF